MSKTNKKKSNHKLIKLFCILVGIIVLLFGSFCIYASFYYHAVDVYSLDSLVVDEVEESNYIKVTNKVASNDNVLILYPGAKVESKAYLHLASEIATTGATVYIIKAPFHFAFFSTNAADKIVKIEKESNPNAKFYLAGHSLGGATAGIYLENNSDKFEGAIFLASYTTKDLTNTNLKCLSIYGSNDEVLNKDKYEACKANLPSLREYVIEGGNHAYFGSYGVQKGDGEASISIKTQTLLTSARIVAFMATGL